MQQKIIKSDKEVGMFFIKIEMFPHTVKDGMFKYSHLKVFKSTAV